MDEDFEGFLKNVDKISELIKDLNSSDAEVQQKAMTKAECCITAMDETCRTKMNKTTINTHPSSQAIMSRQNNSPACRNTSVNDGGHGIYTVCLSQERKGKWKDIFCHEDYYKEFTCKSFMKIMEKDAEARRLQRIDREKKATALKYKGNKAYAQEDYETAVKYYSDGLAELRDMQPLYTNRAQAFIKLGKYKEAINDCEWALKCNERCIKAYLHMGKAYLALKKYNESRNCFEKILEFDPTKEKIAKEYLTQVELEEKREHEEISAMAEYDSGHAKATVIPHLLKKLSKPDQLPVYYCGGYEILSQAVTECTGQTIFRLNNGFSIISSNDTVKSCLLQNRLDPGSQELCISVLKLWSVICDGNDENQKILMTCPLSRQSIVHLVTSENVAVQKESLALLCLFSQMPHGRRMAMDNLNTPMLVRNLMACITKQQQQQKQQNLAVNILENFAAEDKFSIQLRDMLSDSVIVPFTVLLRNLSETSQQVLSSMTSIVGRLALDDVIRHKFAHDPECWKAFVVAIKQCSVCEYKEVLYTMLGLIINLSSITSPAIREQAVALCDCCLGLLKDSNGGIITRATGVLSTVLPQSSEAIQRVIQGDVVRTMRRLLKGTGQTATKYAIKTLTVCTAASLLAREELLKSDKKLSILRHLLGSSCDEMVAGNAALCLAHCIELEGIASNLLGTDIVPLLLRHAAGDVKRTAVQQNAAIALGKLCRSEPRHICKLRELHGIEILHSCVKLIS